MINAKNGPNPENSENPERTLSLLMPKWCILFLYHSWILSGMIRTFFGSLKICVPELVNILIFPSMQYPSTVPDSLVLYLD